MSLSWVFLLITLHLVSSRGPNVEPEYLDYLRATGRDEEFAKLMGVDVKFVRADDSEGRSEGSIINRVSPLGDILLPEEQDRQGINFGKYPGNKWSNGIIPYVVGRGEFSSSERSTIDKGIDDWNQNVEKPKLTKRYNENDYVYMFKGSGCYSNLGRVGGKQSLSLGNGCVFVETVQHEFMHAAGVIHEHCRSDRDNYITILWGNITQDWQSQYEKADPKDFLLVGDYDPDSIMHYHNKAPVKYTDDSFVMKDKNMDANKVGRSKKMTNMDIAKMKKLYS